MVNAIMFNKTGFFTGMNWAPCQLARIPWDPGSSVPGSWIQCSGILAGSLECLSIFYEVKYRIESDVKERQKRISHKGNKWYNLFIDFGQDLDPKKKVVGILAHVWSKHMRLDPKGQSENPTIGQVKWPDLMNDPGRPCYISIDATWQDKHTSPMTLTRAAESTNFNWLRLRLRLRSENIDSDSDSDSASTPA